jgi:6-phospho-beta-glucosidase
MARIRIAYIGGGSTRAPGTLASIVTRGPQFAGSEVVLVDLDEERMGTVKQLTERMAAAHGVDLRVSTTTDRRDALGDADFVLSSFRPGGFEARYLDESIPARHGVLGQETQGPGGFFMALRSIQVIRAIVEDMERICPTAFLINYTNPVNIVSEAVTHNSPIRTISLCEGPITFPQAIVRNAGLDPRRLDAVHVGLNHTGWTVRHLYDGEDVMPLIREAAVARAKDPSSNPRGDRMLHLAAAMGALPAWYLYYYYFRDEALAEQRASPTTRAQDILAEVDGYWSHYREQAASDDPVLDPARSRGGILELELAIDVIDAIANDLGRTWPGNVPNERSLPGFPDDMVVEVPTHVDREGARPIPQAPLPAHVRGLIQMLGAYQAATARAAWSGTRGDAVAALASNPLVLSLTLAERLYDEMAAAHRQHLPLRLLEG